MKIIKEYSDDKTKIRIHDDYIGTKEDKIIKEIIISLMINSLKKYNN